eukprot:1532501-Rhodomonas_salina.2
MQARSWTPAVMSARRRTTRRIADTNASQQASRPTPLVPPSHVSSLLCLALVCAVMLGTDTANGDGGAVIPNYDGPCDCSEVVASRMADGSVALVGTFIDQ